MLIFERGVVKNFQFDTICNITQELQRINCACGFIGKSSVIQSIPIKCINGKSCFEQLVTVYSAPSLTFRLHYTVVLVELKKTTTTTTKPFMRLHCFKLILYKMQQQLL